MREGEVMKCEVRPIPGDEARVLRVIGRLRNAVKENGSTTIIDGAEQGAVLNALVFATLPRDEAVTVTRLMDSRGTE